LKVVRVLVGDHVRDGEVAGGAAVSSRLTGQVLEDAAVEVGGQMLADIDGVVDRAVERARSGPRRRPRSVFCGER